MSTKIFNDQIISQSQLQSFQDDAKQNINPYEIKYTQRQPMIIPLFITKQQEQSKTITVFANQNNERSHKKTSHVIIQSQPKRLLNFSQQTLKKQICIPLIPITFADLINYSQKCQQIRSLITYHTQADFIKWIQQNNQQNCNIKINCNLLNLIKSQSFWKNIIIKMLDDILLYSEDIGYGKILFFNEKIHQKIKQQNAKNYYSLNRFYCYILLCQMFFGLIPIQYHLLKYNSLCTFAYYMQMNQSNFTCKQYEQFTCRKYEQQEYELSQQQQQKMHKLKSLIFYFSIMSQTQNQKKIQKQNIKVQYSKFQFQNNILYDPKNNDNQDKNYDHQQDYGQVGDVLLCQNITLQSTNICNQNKNKPNQESKFNSDHYDKSIRPVYFVENSIDDINNLKNSKLVKLMFEHPQIFQIKQQQIIVVSNLKKFSICSYQQGKFTTLGRSDVQTLKVSETKQSNRKVFVKSRQNNKQSIHRYTFNNIKIKLQNYVSILKPAIKTYYKKTIQIDFKEFLSLFQYPQKITISNDKNIYQEFMLIWIALSYINMASCKIKIKIQNISKEVLYNLNKIYSQLSQRQIADCLSIMSNYEKRPKKQGKIKRLKINLSKIQKPQYLSFIQYLKKYAF